MKLSRRGTLPVVLLPRRCVRCGQEFGSFGKEHTCGPCRAPKQEVQKMQSDVLTPRELSVAALVAEARSNQEIAKLLRLKSITVREYLREIYKKLSLRNRTALALWYWEQHGIPTVSQIR